MEAKFAHAISPRERLRLIEGFVRTKLVGPSESPLCIAAGLTVTFGPGVCPQEQSIRFSASELLNPSYSFDPESVKTHAVPDAGLKQWGPYSRARLNGQRLRVLVLAPTNTKGQVEQFVQQFQQGILGYEGTFNGFIRKYRLTDISFTERYFPGTGGPPADTYYNATVAALDESTEYDLCIIVIRESFKGLPTRDNPYYVCKALLLSFGIPVQDVLIETLRLPEANLQWILNTLASYFAHAQSDRRARHRVGRHGRAGAAEPRRERVVWRTGSTTPPPERQRPGRIVPVQRLQDRLRPARGHHIAHVRNTRLGVASYAKLGGTPYVLKARQMERHELVFGIGRSIERESGSRLGASEQIIGFTTVFRSDGDFLLNACTPYTDFANYERRLEEVILRSVSDVAARKVSGMARQYALSSTSTSAQGSERFAPSRTRSPSSPAMRSNMRSFT